MTDHQITPPPELVTDWCGQLARENDYGPTCVYDIATQAARWGADQELEACCEWLPKLPPWSADDLRRHRRPKPPSLKDRIAAAITDGDERKALKLLEELDDSL